MRPRTFVGAAVTVLAAWSGLSAADGSVTLPEIEGVPALASVNGEPIPLDAFERALMSVHTGEVEPETTTTKRDPSALLERLITIRLVVQESYNIGLDQLDDVRTAIALKRDEVLREMVLRSASEQLGDPTPEELSRRVRIEGGKARFRYVLSGDAEVARAIAAALRGGETFGDVVAPYVADGRAKTEGSDDVWVEVPKLWPELGSALAAAGTGDVVGPVEVEDGFAVVELLEFDAPDDPEFLAGIERNYREVRGREMVSELSKSLEEKYARIDRELFESLDYEAEGIDFDAFLADDRVIATIEGGDPITVGDLSRELQKRFFHGVARALEQGRINEKKEGALDRLLFRDLLVVEAERRKIPESDEFRARLEEFEEGILFGTFVAKVIDPDVRLRNEEVRAYYDEHADEFLPPEVMRLESIPFVDRERADEAAEKVRQGADLAWIRENAPGRIEDDGSDPSLLRFRNVRYDVSRLPDGVRSALAGALAGDVRTFHEENGPSYVLYVRDRDPRTPLPFDAVKTRLAQRLFAERREEAIEDWAQKLRDASEIERFVTGDELTQLLRERAGM